MNPTLRRKRRSRFGLLMMLALVAFGLRVYRLDFQPLWWDEGISVYLANADVATILRNRAQDVHPPLYFGLLKAWVLAASSRPFAVRYLSAMIGTLAVTALYPLVRRVSGVRAGLVATGLLALSPFAIYHSQEARMYPAAVLLAILTTYLLVRLRHDIQLSRRRSLSLWALYALLTTCALLTHYYLIFLPIAQGVYVLLWRRRDLARWLGASALAAVLYAPWLLAVVQQLPRRVADKVAFEVNAATSPLLFGAQYLATVTTGYTSGARATWVLATLATVVLVIGLTRGPRRARLPLVLVAVPVVGGLALNQLFPLEQFPRLLGYTSVGVYWLLALGLTAIGGRRFWWAVPVAALALLALPYGALYTADRHAAEDYRPVIRRIDDLAQTRDLVILDFIWQAGYLESYGPTAAEWWLAPGEAWARNPGQFQRDMQAVLAAHSRVWYIAAEGLGSRRGENVEGYLVHNAYPALNEWLGINRLLLFGTATAGTLQPRDVVFGPSLRLTGLARPETAAAGSVLPFQLRWTTTAPIEPALTAFVHLLDASGQVAAQRDTEPVNGLQPTLGWQPGEQITDRLGVLVPAETEPGTYRIEIGWYDPATGERWPVTRGAPAASALELAPVRVTASRSGGEP